MNVTTKIIDIVLKMKEMKFSKEVLELSKRCLLDYIGVTVAGATVLKERGSKFIELLEEDGKITVIGFNRKAHLTTASFINGLSAHILELDDGMNSGIIHPGSPVISSLLPLAEKYKINGLDLLKSIIVGYEITCLLANMIQPSHKLKGYHATGTCGTIGSAVAIAFMLNYSNNEIKDALANAVLSSSGFLKVLEDNSELKPFNVAKASMNGVIAATMSKSGFVTPNDVFSGDNGFFKMMSDKIDFSILNNWSSKHLFIQKTYVKPYAACRYCHPAIDATIILRNKHSFNLEEIEKIIVSTYSLAVKNHDHRDISSISSAKMSIPFSVAVVLVTGYAGINEFSEQYIFEKNVQLLLPKISVKSVKEFTESFPNNSIAEVEIFTKSKDYYKERIDHPKGEPENPLSKDELIQKFSSLATLANMPRDNQEKIIDTVWNVEERLEDLYCFL